MGISRGIMTTFLFMTHFFITQFDCIFKMEPSLQHLGGGRCLSTEEQRSCLFLKDKCSTGMEPNFQITYARCFNKEVIFLSFFLFQHYHLSTNVLAQNRLSLPAHLSLLLLCKNMHSTEEEIRHTSDYQIKRTVKDGSTVVTVSLKRCSAHIDAISRVNKLNCRI